MERWIEDSFETLDELKAYIGKKREMLFWLERAAHIDCLDLTEREAKLMAYAVQAAQSLDREGTRDLVSALSEWHELQAALDEREEAMARG